jgi:hypothetical protein
MPQGISNHAIYHDCQDGQRRQIESVYMRVLNSSGNRVMRRFWWYCPVCKVGNWIPLKKNGDKVLPKEVNDAGDSDS